MHASLHTHTHAQAVTMNSRKWKNSISAHRWGAWVITKVSLLFATLQNGSILYFAFVSITFMKSANLSTLFDESLKGLETQRARIKDCVLVTPLSLWAQFFFNYKLITSPQKLHMTNQDKQGWRQVVAVAAGEHHPVFISYTSSLPCTRALQEVHRHLSSHQSALHIYWSKWVLARQPSSSQQTELLLPVLQQYLLPPKIHHLCDININGRLRKMAENVFWFECKNWARKYDNIFSSRQNLNCDIIQYYRYNMWHPREKKLKL